jgi:hypothetical protein
MWNDKTGMTEADGLNLQKCGEFIYREIGLTDDCSKRASVQFFVIRHNDLAKRIRPPKDDMTPLLPSNHEARSFKRFDACPSGDARQLAHTAISTASKCSSGTGRLSSLRAAT